MANKNKTNTESQKLNNKDDAKANGSAPKSKSKSHIQDTLQVQFTTKIAEQSMQCDDTIYALTSKLRPEALSQVVNHVLNKEEESQQVDFDFLIDNKYIRGSLARHLSENEISSEQTVTIEYIEKTIEPSAKSNNQHPDWVSCVDAIKSNLFLTGCYDGIVRVWKAAATDKTPSKTQLFCQHRGHISPIKGITALYSVSSSVNVHYFASVSKDRSVKIFGLNENSKEIKQVSKIDTKSSVASHRFSVECCSAPFPSKVFATGSADREIKIYRLKNKDTLDNEGPATKKQKLNVTEHETSSFMTDNDDDAKENKIGWCSLSNISTLRGHRDAIKCLDWNNPLALYSGSWDNGIKLWDVHKEIDAYTWWTQSGVTCLKYWNAQNVLISAHSNLKIAIWDPRTDRNISSKSMSQMTFRSHRLPITDIDVDGSAGDTNNAIKNSDYLFVTSSHDGKLKIWDIRSTSPLYNIEKHKGKALCVGWYGNTIVSGGSDCKLQTLKWRK